MGYKYSSGMLLNKYKYTHEGKNSFKIICMPYHLANIIFPLQFGAHYRNV